MIPLWLLLLLLPQYSSAGEVPYATHAYRGPPPAQSQAGAGVVAEMHPQAPEYYRVRKGDTLERISHLRRVRVSTLVENNGLRPPYVLYPGEYLCIRRCPRKEQVNEQTKRNLRYYRVREGDSLGVIARRLGISSSLIIRRNGLRPPYLLRIGQRLCVDRKRDCEPRHDASAGERGEERKKAVDRYVVRPGDSLRRIAARHGLNYKDIARWNGIEPPYTIYVGQVLRFYQSAKKQRLEDGAVRLPNRRYRVRRYETLDYLSNRFSIPEQTLIELNHLKKPYKLKSGQILCLDNPAPCLSQVHIVVKGETLEQIAQLYDIEISRLVELNMLDPPYRVFPDQRICLQKRYPCEGAQRMNGLPKDWMPRLDWPLANDHEIVQPFGRRAGRMHEGVDISAIEGTPVLAAADGKVIFSGEKFDNKDKHASGYGKFIIIEHPNHVFTIYAHNSRNLVFSGRMVHQGDVIAKSGASGRARRPVLHFELRKGDVPIDPLPYLPKREAIIYEQR